MTHKDSSLIGDLVRNTRPRNALSLDSSDSKLGTVGRAVAKAVSRWLPTAAVWVSVREGMWGFVVDKVALGQIFFF
jgi:hypothetical protein